MSSAIAAAAAAIRTFSTVATDGSSWNQPAGVQFGA